jgi:hypothetical protein
MQEVEDEGAAEKRKAEEEILRRKAQLQKEKDRLRSELKRAPFSDISANQKR